MNTVDYTATLEISTDCTCEVYDDEGELIPTNHCFGCWSDSKADIIQELEFWLDRNEVEAVEVFAERMLWTNTSALTWVPSKAESLFDLLTLNGDYRLEFYWDSEDTLTARRWSHDEPVGTGLFTFKPVPAEALDQ